MPWAGPAHADDFPSLGWELLDWMADVLPSPRDPASPLVFTDEQAMQIVEWFRIDPARGRLPYRRGYSRRSKGWGKSPVEAAKAIAEFAGPVRFAGWDAAGQPVGMPWGTTDAPRAWVQIGALSEDQTDNTWSVIHYLLTENDGRAADALGIDAGLTRCFLRGQPGAKLEPVTSAAGSREGQPITYGVIDESHLMLPTNGGVKLARTIRRNVAKMGGRSYETTNAYEIGAESVAESSHAAVLAGSPGIFADEVEAPRVIDGVPVNLDAPDEVLLKALDVAYGASWWVDRRRLVEDVRDPSNTWVDSSRFFFNWPTKLGVEQSLIPGWDALVDPSSVAVSHHAWALAVSPLELGPQWSSIGIAGRREDGLLHVAWVKHAPGTGWVVAACREMFGKRAVPLRVHKSGPEGALIKQLVEAGVEVEGISSMDVAQACGAFIAAAVGTPASEDSPAVPPSLRHLGQPSLTLAVRSAVLRSGVDGAVVWSQRKSSVEITPLQAVTVAVGGVPAEVTSEFVSMILGG